MRLVVVVLSGIALASAVAFGMRAGPEAHAEPARRVGPARVPLLPTHAAVESQAAAPTTPFAALPPLEFVNLNTHEALSIRLYAPDGQVDAVATEKLSDLLIEPRDAAAAARPPSVHIAQRTLQLVYRAAYHFRAQRVEVVSAYREPRRGREGPHTSGRAVDFKLVGTTAAALAAYLRTLSRVGVGVYTHPKTQYVHLDVRKDSFHWLDASPPGRTWRERSIGSRALPARDAAYSLANDWPEGTRTP